MSDEKKETNSPTTAEDKEEKELPPEVDAFLKGKNKYKHPYGDWKPVVKTEPLKRKTFVDQLDLPTDNWHMPENQPVPLIPDANKDESHVKVIFKEKEIPTLSATTTGKNNETIVFKKRKTASNRQLRGSASGEQKKRSSDEL